MFDEMRRWGGQMVAAVQQKYDGFVDSVDRFNRDMLEIRNLFVSVKNIIFAVCSFIGQQTAVLLFCTFLFLFVVNLIPFLFLDKKVRYYIGICFGVWLGMSFGYTLWATVKYALIMLSPVMVECLIVRLFKLSGGALKSMLEKLWILLKKSLSALFRKIFGRERQSQTEEGDDEKEC